MFKRVGRVLRALILFLLTGLLQAQTLGLSSAAISSAGTAALNVTLTGGGNSAAALQWKFQYPAAALSLFSASAGPALTAAGKTLTCQAASGSYVCIASGMNAATIADGVIAIITATASQTASITISNQVAATATGSGLALSATGGSITLPITSVAVPVLSSLSCTPTSIAGNSSSNCTVTLNGPATAATSITLSSSTTAAAVPSTVSIPSGSSAAQFAVTSNGSVTASATLTATLNGIAKTFSLPLTAAAPTLSSLSCTPTSIAGNSSSNCTVTLSGPATAATSIALSANNSAMILPQSAIVAAGSASVQFAAVSSGSVNATATLTASLGGTSKTFNVALTTSTFSLRIHAGAGQYVDAQGNTWNPDSGYTGGSQWSTTNTLANTNAAALYQSVRWGNFGYQFTVPNGNYTVNLKFAEVSLHSIGQRIFSVAINGAAVLQNFDVVASAGGPLVALDKAFPVTVTNGAIQIGFYQGAANFPMVNAIEIVQQGTPLSATATPTPTTFTPLFINSGGSAVTDSLGLGWAADKYYTNGTPWSTAHSIIGTLSPQLYQSCRYGNFYYPISVPNGNYAVILKFAEISRTGAGQRVFNVQINGKPVLTNFDIIGAVGAPFVTLDKTFLAVVSNGALVLGFTQGPADLPLVNAIEILPAN